MSTRPDEAGSEFQERLLDQLITESREQKRQSKAEEDVPAVGETASAFAEGTLQDLDDDPHGNPVPEVKRVGN